MDYYVIILEETTSPLRGPQVLEQARHPSLKSVPLLSRSASSAGATQGRSRKDLSLVAKPFEHVEADDHRVAALNFQGQGLDDAWTALLGSTLATNSTVRSVNLNRHALCLATVTRFCRHAWSS